MVCHCLIYRLWDKLIFEKREMNFLKFTPIVDTKLFGREEYVRLDSETVPYDNFDTHKESIAPINKGYIRPRGVGGFA